MPEDGWTIDEAVEHLDPPIPRRTLAALLAQVRPIPGATRWGRRGRKPAVYRRADLLQAHADWLDRHREY